MSNDALTNYVRQDPHAKIRTLRDYLQARASKLAELLPQQLGAERMLTLALAAASRKPDLLQATPESLYLALHRAASLGLEADGPLEEAYLITYRNGQLTNKMGVEVREAQLSIGYKGLITLARNTGRVDGIEARVVYEGDDFQFRFGTPSSRLHHVPTLADNPGPMLAAYCITYLKGSAHPHITVLPRRDVMEARKASPGANRSDSPWKTAEGAMWIKTAIRRNLALVPKSASDRLAEALAVDERQDEAVGTASIVEDIPADAKQVEAVAVAAIEAPAETKRPSRGSQLAGKIRTPVKTAPKAEVEPATEAPPAEEKQAPKQQAAAGKATTQQRRQPQQATLAVTDEEPPPPGDEDAPQFDDAEPQVAVDPSAEWFERIRSASTLADIVGIQARARRLPDPVRVKVERAAHAKQQELTSRGRR